jgi:ABC-type multidrug transport system fused ATPase/permease subunit
LKLLISTLVKSKGELWIFIILSLVNNDNNLKAMIMMNLRLSDGVLTMKSLKVMMRLMIWLIRTHIRLFLTDIIIYVIYFASVSKYIFYMCYLLTIITGGWTKIVGDGSRRGSTRMTKEEAQQNDVVQQQVEQQATVDAAQQDDDDAQQDAFGASGSTHIYLQGPASLP